MIISLVGTGIQLFSWAYWIFDFLIIDLIARFVLGTWCKFCAYLWIWIFKIATLPFWLIGLIWWIFLEIMTFPVAGWMIFFKGQGCVFIWGRDCWFTEVSPPYWKVLDVPFLMKKDAKQKAKTLFDTVFSMPSYEDFNDFSVEIGGKSRRMLISDTCPASEAFSLFKRLA